MTEHGHADARQEVDVLAALGVVQARTVRHARARPACACRSAARVARRRLGYRLSWTWSLPFSRSTRSSRPCGTLENASRAIVEALSDHARALCASRVPAAAANPLASRPLTIAIEPTPAVSASRQARSFATMPADAVPSAIIRSMPSRSSMSIVAPAAVEHAGGAAGDDQPIDAARRRRARPRACRR